MSPSEKNIGTLIFPNGYLHELNQVAGVTSENIVFLKRKFVSKEGWELVKIPLSECFEVNYKEEVSVAGIAVGALISALIAGIALYLFQYWDDLEAGTKVPIGALGLAGFYGVRMALGGRRHRLKFEMHGGEVLSWKSRAGDRELMADSVKAIVEFARSKGLLASPGG
jgi:hypothetical protein